MKFILVAGIKDEPEVKKFLMAPSRRDWFLHYMKEGKAPDFQTGPNSVKSLAESAGLVEENVWTEKAFKLALEFGIDVKADQAARDAKKAEKDAIKPNSELLKIDQTLQLTIPVIIKEIQVVSLTSGDRVGYEYRINYDQATMEKEIDRLIVGLLKEIPGLPEVSVEKPGGSHSLIGFLSIVDDPIHEELTQKKYW